MLALRSWRNSSEDMDRRDDVRGQESATGVWRLLILALRGSD